MMLMRTLTTKTKKKMTSTPKVMNLLIPFSTLMIMVKFLESINPRALKSRISSSNSSTPMPISLLVKTPFLSLTMLKVEMRGFSFKELIMRASLELLEQIQTKKPK